MSDRESTVNWWKQKTEELRLQLHLGKKEAEEKFEEEKKRIEHWAETTREEIGDLSSGKAKAFKAKLDTLRLQAALGKAESKSAVEEQEKKLKLALEDAQKEAQHLAEDSSEKIATVGRNAQDKMGIWQTQMDIFRLQLQLGKKEAEVEWETKKKQIREKLNEMDHSIEQMKKDGSESLDNFKSEISKSWKHFKSAFSKD
ncbi:MAG: hypothetical protein ABR574_07705 [Cryomorphaceae bacterium]|nr:hypothetical protein [Flavobacteriales bacterium]